VKHDNLTPSQEIASADQIQPRKGTAQVLTNLSK